MVIADDDVLLREGVAHLLGEEGFEVVGLAGDAVELLALAAAQEPDVAVIDMRMPPTHSLEGVEAALELRRARPGMGVMLLSMYVETRHLDSLLEQGARGLGYLLKGQVTSASFAADLRSVAAGGSVIDPEVVSVLLRRQGRDCDDQGGDLSGREREVLALMAEGRSNPAIAQKLFLNQKTGRVSRSPDLLQAGTRAPARGPPQGAGRAQPPASPAGRARLRRHPSHREPTDFRRPMSSSTALGRRAVGRR